MQLSYEDWKQQYKPIPNHLNPNASYDGLLFETYGDESAFITAQPHNAVWTLLDCEGKLVLGNGCHVVNRLGYVVTEVPVPEGVDIEVVDDDDDNPNENCLQGMACPACGDFGPFKILVSQSGMTRVSDEGTDSIEGDMEWEDDSPCECLECGHTGKVGQFKGQPDPEFDEFQQVVIESYNGGDHPAHAPGDIHDCGDTLLTFLLVELSKREDCDSFGCAVDRLDSAIRQLTEVRAAFEAKDLVSEPKQDPVVRVRPVGQSEEWGKWNITQNLTDRWGELNYHDAANKPLGLLESDHPLLERLRAQMWDELTFVVRKDGQFGILFEAEFCSRESEAQDQQCDSAWYASLKPYSEVVKALLDGMAPLMEKFPGVQFAVPDQTQVINGRPAAWAFVADGLLSDVQRAELGQALLSL